MPLTSMYSTYLSAATPTIALTNLTHPDLAPNFDVGDTYRMTITGPPNQPVSMVQTANGGTSQQTFGNTDAYGHMTVDYVEQTSDIGSYTQVWSVGGIQASPAVSFVVGQLGDGGTISTTELGVTTDGHVVGVSTLSIANGTAGTYSATELDYTASLYYNAGTVGTLYEEGTAIRSGSASNSGLADGYMSAPASAWKDYDLQTDHYVIAYIPYGIYFENPFYYQDGSCGDVSSDCTFGPGGGIYYVTAASIYLGSTLADQADVPQDASIPLVDDSAYNSFLDSAQKPIPSDVLFKVDAWSQAIRNVIPALFIAESVYDSQNQVNTYPLPLYVELVHDEQTPWISPNPVRRTRTYVVRDTKGHKWVHNNPLTIYESLIYVAGQGVMPTPNAPPNDGWRTTLPDGIQSDAQMDDLYGQLFPGQPEVDYWQQYWATGFNAPGTVLPPIPGFAGPTIPLMIKDTLSRCKTGFFGTQGIEMRADYVGVNGDRGPGTTCAN